MTTPNYTKMDYAYTQHVRRYRRRVEAQPRKIVCQECRGCGELFEDRILGHDLTITCGVCCGTGLLTPWMRGQWLKWKRQEKAEAAK